MDLASKANRYAKAACLSWSSANAQEGFRHSLTVNRVLQKDSIHWHWLATLFTRPPSTSYQRLDTHQAQWPCPALMLGMLGEEREDAPDSRDALLIF